MALAEDIANLRESTIADLVAAWQIVQRAIDADWAFAIENDITGTTVPRGEVIPRARQYIERELPESTFQQFLAIFESFPVDFLRLWLFAYPRGITSRKSVDFQVIVDAPDRDIVLREIIDLEIRDLTYKRPADWFAFIESRVHLVCPSPEDIEEFAEAKAMRDLLARNRGVVNRLYFLKAGARARFVEGERVEIAEPYHRQVWNLCRRLVADIATAAVARAR